MTYWVSGAAQTGKTTMLIDQLERWVTGGDESSPAIAPARKEGGTPSVLKPLLVFAANSDNRGVLVQRIAQRVKGQASILSTTPLAFFEAEVQLFWPLIIEQLRLRGYFPQRLRPETEQDLALRLWGMEAIAQLQQAEGASVDRWVRRILDLIQLAASSGTPLSHLAARLKTGIAETPLLSDELATLVQTLALQWRSWCLTRGVLTYGLITDLFWQFILTHPDYCRQLPQRFGAIAADDVDTYPAITRVLFEQLLQGGLPGIFTYSTLGGLRDGLGADSAYLLGLRSRCTEDLVLPLTSSIAAAAEVSVPDMSRALQAASAHQQPEFYTLQTTTRVELLQRVADQVAASLQSGAVQPQHIAIVGPGLDPLARYAMVNALQQHGIPVESLRDQRPLQSSALVRSLLTLLALVYPGLGQLLEPEQVAEMLVVLTAGNAPAMGLELRGAIDPVRAGLLADYCFRPHPDYPHLLPVETFTRWDRIGNNAAQAYDTLRQWIAQQQGNLRGNPEKTGQAQPSPYLTLSPVFVLDRAIQTFLMNQPLTPDQLAGLRELMETAQHYWDVDARLRKIEPNWPILPETIHAFIGLLQRGVVTANPYPTALGLRSRPAVVLATTFQYLNARLQHPWHFWLDAGSQLWQYSGDTTMWGAPLFLKPKIPPSSALDDLDEAQQTLKSTLLNLLGRVQERVYLCHSELATNGQEQLGPLLPWIEEALPTLDTEALIKNG